MDRILNYSRKYLFNFYSDDLDCHALFVWEREDRQRNLIRFGLKLKC